MFLSGMKSGGEGPEIYFKRCSTHKRKHYLFYTSLTTALLFVQGPCWIHNPADLGPCGGRAGQIELYADNTNCFLPSL